MCGILAYIGNTLTLSQIKQYASLIAHRGPDNTKVEQIDENIIFAFHRLAIVGLNEEGNQPLHFQELESNNRYSLICNGEIYNYKEIAEAHRYDMKSGSDCEVILHLFAEYGDIKKVSSMLDGVFAFVLHDHNRNITYVSRDPFGVRPLFVGTTMKGEYVFSSEAKAICVGRLCMDVEQFPPGKCWSSAERNEFQTYHDLTDNERHVPENVNNVYADVEEHLVNAVKKRMMSDRKVGCLLSGGLDSSLVAGILCRLMKEQGIEEPLETYSIGLEGSPDLHYAEEVANYLGTKHHTVIFTESEGLRAVEDVIFAIESYDITTIRASVGMYLLAKYIKENSDDVVIFSGEGSDEVAEGYLYFFNAPTVIDAHEESLRLIRDLHFFDLLRGDRTTAAHGLELRVPFLDKKFVKYYTSLHPHLKRPIENMEKYVLRKSFDGKGYIPDSVLWRRKEAFSDGVSGLAKSWFSILQDYIDGEISDAEYEYNGKSFNTKEAYYYKKVYDKYYNVDLIPYYWMPKWSDTNDPSARTLNVYSNIQ